MKELIDRIQFTSVKDYVCYEFANGIDSNIQPTH